MISNKTIAVIEDNPDNRLLVQAILRKAHRIVEFENGPAALAALPLDPPDLVLLDISLPEMDGREVLQRMRSVPELAEVPVIALTAHAMAGDRSEYLDRGFDDYVAKPITDPAAFRSQVERWL